MILYLGTEKWKRVEFSYFYNINSHQTTYEYDYNNKKRFVNVPKSLSTTITGKYLLYKLTRILLNEIL